MNPVKSALVRLGINHSTVASLILRELSLRYGHPRLRELRAEVLAGDGVAHRAGRRAVRWLERGQLYVTRGRPAGLQFEMRHLPVSHAQLGSIALGDLETPVQEAIVRHLPSDGVFYDIGANIGFFTVLAGLIAPAGCVYAFEPVPGNAEAVAANAALNRMQNIVVIAKAVGAEPGKARLQVVDDQSWSRLEQYGRHPHTEAVIDVEVVSIDDLVEHGGLRPPTLVKIDVEGGELAVLEGMRRTIAAHQPAIICELHETQESFLSLLAELGYRAANLDAATPLSEAGVSTHALALPVDVAGD